MKKKNTFLKLIVLSIVVFVFSVIPCFAQKHYPNRPNNTNTNATPNTQGQSQGQTAIDEESLKLKLKAIDELNISEMEKSLMKDEYLTAMGLKNSTLQEASASYTSISFQPKFFPTAIIEKWKSTVAAKYPNTIPNMVTINKAYTIDFNNYFDKDLDKQLTKLIDENPLTEELALECVLPNLYYIQNNTSGYNSKQLVEMMKLYFSSQPGLYYLLPNTLLAKINNEQGVANIMMNQKR